MRRELTSKLRTVSLAALLLTVPQLAAAQEADVTPLNADIGFIFTTFMFLVSGFLVFFMAAGFAMLEAGLVRGKNVAMQLTKNMALFSLASLFFYILGYNLMYPGDGWTIQNVIGAFSVTALEPVGLEGVEADLTYASVGSDFFFQLMFCAATASIVSGALAERIKLWPFLVLSSFLWRSSIRSKPAGNGAVVSWTQWAFKTSQARQLCIPSAVGQL